MTRRRRSANFPVYFKNTNKIIEFPAVTPEEILTMLKNKNALLTMDQITNCMQLVKEKLHKAGENIFTPQEINYVDEGDPKEEMKKEIKFKIKSLNNEFVKKILEIIAEAFFDLENYSNKKEFLAVLKKFVDGEGLELFYDNQRGVYKKIALKVINKKVYNTKSFFVAVRNYEKVGRFLENSRN